MHENPDPCRHVGAIEKDSMDGFDIARIELLRRCNELTVCECGGNAGQANAGHPHIVGCQLPQGSRRYSPRYRPSRPARSLRPCDERARSVRSGENRNLGNCGRAHPGAAGGYPDTPDRPAKCDPAPDLADFPGRQRTVDERTEADRHVGLSACDIGQSVGRERSTTMQG
jgi:hypothetical protein